MTLRTLSQQNRMTINPHHEIGRGRVKKTVLTLARYFCETPALWHRCSQTRSKWVAQATSDELLAYSCISAFQKALAKQMSLSEKSGFYPLRLLLN